MDLDFTKYNYQYTDLKFSLVNFDKNTIKAFLKHLGKEEFLKLLQIAQINLVPEKLSDFYFKFDFKKCYLYIAEPEGDFKICEVAPFYIPRENWKMRIRPKSLSSGDKGIIPFVND